VRAYLFVTGNVFRLPELHIMETYEGSGGKAPRILNLCSRLKWSASR